MIQEKLVPIKQKCVVHIPHFDHVIKAGPSENGNIRRYITF